MLAYGLTFAPYISNILQMPNTSVLPIVVMLTAIGAYAVNLRTTDLIVMFIFGLLGYVMRCLKFPTAPIILGIILGPMADENFRRSMITSNGSLAPYFTRPICLIFIVVIFIMLGSNYGWFNPLKKLISRKAQNKAPK